MLYATTRSDRDAFTAHCTLNSNKAADGGAYRVFHAPNFSEIEIQCLLEKNFSQCVADVLNMLFDAKLTSWDVEFTIGRYPVQITSLGHRLHFAEPWHNPDWGYAWLPRRLATLLPQNTDAVTEWVKIAVKIAIMFGAFGNLYRSGIRRADIVVASDDFSSFISAWYARQWGLPVERIVCCCSEDDFLWEMIYHGQIRTDPAVWSAEGKQTAQITNLERLIYECGGTEEVTRFVESCSAGAVYSPGEAVLEKLREGIFVSVSGKKRAENMIPRIYGTYDYLMSADTALSYIGLMDYRSKTGKICDALIFAQTSPQADAEGVARALGITVKELMQHI